MIIARAGSHQRRAGADTRIATLLALTFLTLILTARTASAAVSNASANNQNMLQFMNAERAARGLPALKRDPRLDALAQSWADKMAAARTMYHPGTPQAMSGAGYQSGAQNLAWHDNVLTGAWAHNFWMNSAPHRKNILDPAFTHTGIAMACNPSGGRFPYVFATVEFGGSSSPLSSTPPANPQVAGSQSSPGAGCDGDAPPPPAPAQPPPPAPAPAEPATSKAAAKAAPSVAATKKVSASPPARSSTSAAAQPQSAPSPVVIAPVAGGAGPSGPPPVEESPAGTRQEQIVPVPVANSARAEGNSGPLIALIAGVSGILLATRIAARRRKVRPKHAISRH